MVAIITMSATVFLNFQKSIIVTREEIRTVVSLRKDPVQKGPSYAFPCKSSSFPEAPSPREDSQ